MDGMKEPRLKNTFMLATTKRKRVTQFKEEKTRKGRKEELDEFAQWLEANLDITRPNSEYQKILENPDLLEELLRIIGTTTGRLRNYLF